MTMTRKDHARLLRTFRKIHRWTGAALFVIFLFISISGLLLGWKKHSAGVILAKTEKGTSNNLQDWLPFDSLENNAIRYLHDIDPGLSAEIDRMDVRPDKGTVKIRFKDHFTGLQLDGATGALLTSETRRSDFIENIHDGSIIDNLIGIPNGYFKLFYTTIAGLALLLFTVTGFWLWYGPKRMRKAPH
jgi:hypothetical protein